MPDKTAAAAAAATVVVAVVRGCAGKGGVALTEACKLLLAVTLHLRHVHASGSPLLQARDTHGHSEWLFKSSDSADMQLSGLAWPVLAVPCLATTAERDAAHRRALPRPRSLLHGQQPADLLRDAGVLLAGITWHGMAWQT